MNGYLYMRLRQQEREKEMRRDLLEIAATVGILAVAVLVVL